METKHHIKNEGIKKKNHKSGKVSVKLTVTK